MKKLWEAKMIPPIILGLLKNWGLKIITSKVFWYIVLGVSVLLYWNHLTSTIQDLKIENNKLQEALVQQTTAYNKLKQNYEQILSLHAEYQKTVSKLENEKNRLEKVLYRERENNHSLEQVILKDKKRRVEKLINKASAKVLRCLELLSGAPKKEGEKIDCSVEPEIDEE